MWTGTACIIFDRVSVSLADIKLESNRDTHTAGIQQSSQAPAIEQHQLINLGLTVHHVMYSQYQRILHVLNFCMNCVKSDPPGFDSSSAHHPACQLSRNKTFLAPRMPHRLKCRRFQLLAYLHPLTLRDSCKWSLQDESRYHWEFRRIQSHLHHHETHGRRWLCQLKGTLYHSVTWALSHPNRTQIMHEAYC